MKFSGLLSVSLLVIGFLVIFILYFVKRRLQATTRLQHNSRIKMEKNFRSEKHIWKPFSNKGLYYCNYCEGLMGGIFCNGSSECAKCGLLMHNLCKYKKKKDTIQKCKFVTQGEQLQEINGDKVKVQNPHQFIEGNLPLNAICSVCDLICSSVYELKGSKCIWCHRSVHSDCKEKLPAECDCSYLKNVVIRPNQVKYTKPKQIANNNHKSGSYKKEDDTETELDIKQQDGWSFKTLPSQSPIVVIINKKSGGQLGEAFMDQFYRHLNPIQVIDLLKEGLDRLQLFKDVNNLKILVCGGDGTVASVANYLKEGEVVRKWMSRNPPIAILPIGTGNDLGRALGWGGGGQTEDQVGDILSLVQRKGEPVLHDRWNLQLEKDSKNMIVYNYFSIGLDARVCHGFHDLREKFPYLFKSRIGNKFIYTNVGTLDFVNTRKNALFGSQKSLNQELELIVDGNKVELPDIENIAFVNISSWAGGAQNLWLNEKQIANANNKLIYKPQSFSDNIIEVLGVKNMIHLGQVQTNLQEPIRICQGKKIELIVKAKQHVQVDGEPFMIEPQRVVITPRDQVYMLQNSEVGSDTRSSTTLKFESKILGTLEWAEQHNHINEKQKDILLKKFLQQ